MDRRTLMTRIRKCLALSRSANEHEAAAALAKARELMDAAGLDADDIAAIEIEEATASRPRSQTPAQWEAHLIHTVERLASVHAILGAGCWHFVGAGATPEIATYAFQVLHRQLKRARAEYIRTQLRRCTLARKRLRADLYCRGWAGAVERKICALFPVPVNDPAIGTYLAKRFPGLATINARGSKPKRVTDWSDFARGEWAGKDACLEHGVGSRAAPAQIGQMTG